MPLGLLVTVALNLLEEIPENVFAINGALTVNERELFERLNGIDELIERKLLLVDYKLLFKVFRNVELFF